MLHNFNIMKIGSNQKCPQTPLHTNQLMCIMLRLHIIFALECC